MSTKCSKCETIFDSPFCPNCGSPAEPPVNNQQSELMPPPLQQNDPNQQDNPNQQNNSYQQNNPYQQNQYTPDMYMQQPMKKKHGFLF